MNSWISRFGFGGDAPGGWIGSVGVGSFGGADSDGLKGPIVFALFWFSVPCSQLIERWYWHHSAVVLAADYFHRVSPGTLPVFTALASSR